MRVCEKLNLEILYYDTYYYTSSPQWGGCRCLLITGQVATMTIRKQGKKLILLLMLTVFLCALGNSISKWSNKKVGETQSTKSARKMFYPSVSMTPIFELGFSKSKLSSFKSRKNLTDYNLITSHITSDIISIEQTYELCNG